MPKDETCCLAKIVFSQLLRSAFVVNCPYFVSLRYLLFCISFERRLFVIHNKRIICFFKGRNTDSFDENDDTHLHREPKITQHFDGR